MIGGFGSPGERITRRDTAQESFTRISQSIWFCTKFSIILALIILLDMLVIGWAWGSMLGGEAIILILLNIALGHVRKSRDYAKQALVMGIFVFLIALWPFVADRWVPTWWPLATLPHKPYPTDPWVRRASWWVVASIANIFRIIPGWAKVLYYIPSTIAKGVLGFGVWAAWVEMVDPGGPTAPRKAMSQEGVWYPWYRSSYNTVRLQPDIPQPVAHVVSVQYVDKDAGRMRWNEDIPYEREWIEYCAAMGRGDPFSEPEAAKYGITGAAFTKVRDLLMEEGKLNPPWVLWKDEKNHRQGLEVTEEGRQVFEGIGKAGWECGEGKA
jgi:hypothetical protein